MATEIFIAYVGIYPNVEAAEADYQAIHEMHKELDAVAAYDAAVIERKENGKVKIVKKHETPTRVGGIGGGGIGLATGLVIALFPAAVIGGGLLLGTTAAGAAIGAAAGHAAAGLKRSDLMELGELLDAGEAGLVVVGVAAVGAEVLAAMSNAERVETRELQADPDALALDAAAALA
jgi:uncharacterized membrane protein